MKIVFLIAAGAKSLVDKFPYNIFMIFNLIQSRVGKLMLNHLIGKSKLVSSKVNVKVFVENQRRKLEQEIPHNIEIMYISNSDAFQNFLKKIRKNESSKKHYQNTPELNIYCKKRLQNLQH